MMIQKPIEDKTCDAVFSLFNLCYQELSYKYSRLKTNPSVKIGRWLATIVLVITVGGIAAIAAGCKPVTLETRRFESYPADQYKSLTANIVFKV